MPPGFVAAGIPEMPNPPGPAPKHDLNGAWIGPFKRTIGPYPEMTPAGKAAFALNRPVPSAGQRQAERCSAESRQRSIYDLRSPRDSHAIF